MNLVNSKSQKKKDEKFRIKQIPENFQSASESLDIKPWNSNKLTFISSCIGKKTTHNKIFSLSNRSSNTITKQKKPPLIISRSNCFKSITAKPQTAPQNAGRKKNYKTKQLHPQLSNQLTKLGQVVTQQVLDDNFQQKLESINFYPQFRASLQQRKNLMYLKPYLKTNNRDHKKYNLSTYDGMQKLKTQLYQGIRQSQNLYTQKQNENSETILNAQNSTNLVAQKTNRSSIIQYMTQYQGEQRRDFTQNAMSRKSQSIKPKSTPPLCVLRQKLKNKYRDSSYADKITMIKNGNGVPITIIQ